MKLFRVTGAGRRSGGDFRRALVTAPPEIWPAELQRLRNRMAMVTAASTALLWLDNLSEHYQGGFRRRLMYVPITVGPLVAAAGLVTAISGGRRGGRTFAALSAAQVAIALVGFIEHQRGILKKPGAKEPRGFLFHAWYGPPVAAPLQYLGLGLMGLMSTVAHPAAAPLLARVPANQLMRAFTAVNIPPLWGEIGYLHARGAFQNPAQWIPVISLPVAGAVSAVAAASDSDRAR
ncbi:hypothetical protein, partial [Arthrobacter sp. H5]|uniref:hypothetical protein n=1 Tax=Arthrobacter sp. H5 TaxID=1267973 RepID=UPI00048611B7